MELVEVKNKEPDTIKVVWIINNICTNTCSYCTPDLYNGKNHHYEWEHVEKFIKELQNKYNKIHLSISGGEPTLSPFLLDLCKLVSKNIHITSNGIASLRKYEELSEYVDKWSFSWHPEFQQSGWVDKIYKIAKLSKVSVRIMAPAHKIIEVNDFIKKLNNRELNFRCEVVKVQPRHNSSKIDIAANYDNEEPFLIWYDLINKMNARNITVPQFSIPFTTEEIGFDSVYMFDIKDIDKLRRYFQKKYINSVDIINYEFNKFQGWKCKIGLESLIIQYNGNIKRGNCQVGGIIGKIQDIKNIQWPIDPIICTDYKCYCNVDIRITKKKIS